MTIIDPNKDDKLEAKLNQAFNVHFAALDTALDGVANVHHIMALTVAAAILKSAGSDSPAYDALQLRDEVAALNKEQQAAALEAAGKEPS